MEIINELEALKRGKLRETEIRLENSQKEYAKLLKKYNDLASKNSRYASYLEKYKPLNI